MKNLWKKTLRQILPKAKEEKTRKLIRKIWEGISDVIMLSHNLRTDLQHNHDYQYKDAISAIQMKAHNLIGDLTMLGDALELRKKTCSLEQKEKEHECKECY